MNPLAKPKVVAPPTPEPAPPPPTVDEARANQDALDIARRRRGRAATIFTGATGDTTTPTLSAAKVLGN